MTQDPMQPRDHGYPHSGASEYVDPLTGEPIPAHGQPPAYPPAAYGPVPLLPSPGYPPGAHAPPGYVPQGYPPAFHPPGPYGWQPPRATNGLAIAALVLGVLWIYWLGSVLAVIFGHVARGQIRRTGEGGDGLAIAGLVLGWVGVGILVLVLVIVAFNAR